MSPLTQFTQEAVESQVVGFLSTFALFNFECLQPSHFLELPHLSQPWVLVGALCVSGSSCFFLGVSLSLGLPHFVNLDSRECELATKEAANNQCSRSFKITFGKSVGQLG